MCLSLLGTWHGGSEAEKWQPGKSGLFQVLLSVQGMVLVADPYFNEPAVELMRGTPEGEAASSAYNAARRLETLRWAMVDLLEAPRPGFEQVIAAHFGALRHRIMGKAPAWVAEARTADSSGALAERMERELQKLHGLLEKL